MSRLKIAAIFAFLIIAVSTSSCSMFSGRDQVKQAESTLERGNATEAIRQTKMILNMTPSNIWAKRLLKKIKSKLVKEVKAAMEAENYNEAVKKADIILNKLDNQDEEIKAMRDDAKKFLLIKDAKKVLAAGNPVAALRFVKDALKLDPQLEEAKQLQVEAEELVEGKIDSLMSMAPDLIAQEEFEKLRDLSQDILTIAPQNREVADLLREANAQILARDKVKNLELAQKFFDEGIYESALSRAEEVLKVEPDNKEARTLVENAKAELNKPTLYLNGFTKIKGMVIAHIEMEAPDATERFRVTEGDIFGDFKVSAIDLDLKAVVVTYLKTGSQLSLTVRTE